MQKAHILNELKWYEALRWKRRESSKCSAIAAPDQFWNGVRSSKWFFRKDRFQHNQEISRNFPTSLSLSTQRCKSTSGLVSLRLDTTSNNLSLDQQAAIYRDLWIYRYCYNLVAHGCAWYWPLRQQLLAAFGAQIELLGYNSCKLQVAASWRLERQSFRANSTLRELLSCYLILIDATCPLLLY